MQQELLSLIIESEAWFSSVKSDYPLIEQLIGQRTLLHLLYGIGGVLFTVVLGYVTWYLGLKRKRKETLTRLQHCYFLHQKPQSRTVAGCDDLRRRLFCQLLTDYRGANLAGLLINRSITPSVVQRIHTQKKQFVVLTVSNKSQGLTAFLTSLTSHVFKDSIWRRVIPIMLFRPNDQHAYELNSVDGFFDAHQRIISRLPLLGRIFRTHFVLLLDEAHTSNNLVRDNFVEGIENHLEVGQMLTIVKSQDTKDENDQRPDSDFILELTQQDEQQTILKFQEGATPLLPVDFNLDVFLGRVGGAKSYDGNFSAFIYLLWQEARRSLTSEKALPNPEHLFPEVLTQDEITILKQLAAVSVLGLDIDLPEFDRLAGGHAQGRALRKKIASRMIRESLKTITFASPFVAMLILDEYGVVGDDDLSEQFLLYFGESKNVSMWSAATLDLLRHVVHRLCDPQYPVRYKFVPQEVAKTVFDQYAFAVQARLREETSPDVLVVWMSTLQKLERHAIVEEICERLVSATREGEIDDPQSFATLCSVMVDYQRVTGPTRETMNLRALERMNPQNARLKAINNHPDDPRRFNEVIDTEWRLRRKLRDFPYLISDIHDVVMNADFYKLLDPMTFGLMADICQDCIENTRLDRAFLGNLRGVRTINDLSEFINRCNSVAQERARASIRSRPRHFVENTLRIGRLGHKAWDEKFIRDLCSVARLLSDNASGKRIAAPWSKREVFLQIQGVLARLDWEGRNELKLALSTAKDELEKDGMIQNG